MLFAPKLIEKILNFRSGNLSKRTSTNVFLNRAQDVFIVSLHLLPIPVDPVGDASFSFVNLCSKVDILKLFLQFLLLYCMIKEKADRRWHDDQNCPV